MGFTGCNRIMVPGPLDPPVALSIAHRGMHHRWVCTCGAVGNWLPIERLRQRTVNQRLDANYDAHVKRRLLQKTT